MTTHAFSFGDHYDPDNVGLGPLIAHNDEVLDPGCGYALHPHRDVELVTVVLSGSLHHRDSSGDEQVLPAGAVQVHSTGAGVEHEEYGDPGAPTRFVQSWVRPDRAGTEPVRHVAAPASGAASGWVALAGGEGLPLGCEGAVLWRAYPSAGKPLTLPPGALHQVYVIAGAVALAEHGLGPGDEARITGTDTPPLEAGGDSDVLCWSFAG